MTITAQSLSQMFAREAWRLLEANFEKVLKQPGDLERARRDADRRPLSPASPSRIRCSASAHACANPLTAHYGLTHGIAIGILLPHVVRFNAAAVGALYADLVHEVGLLNGDEAAAGEVLAQRITA